MRLLIELEGCEEGDGGGAVNFQKEVRRCVLEWLTIGRTGQR